MPSSPLPVVLNLNAIWYGLLTQLATSLLSSATRLTLV